MKELEEGEKEQQKTTKTNEPFGILKKKKVVLNFVLFHAPLSSPVSSFTRRESKMCFLRAPTAVCVDSGGHTSCFLASAV